MTHFEYMEQEGQLTIFDVLDEYELLQFKRSFTNVSKPVDNELKGPRRVGYIVRR